MASFTALCVKNVTINRWCSLKHALSQEGHTHCRNTDNSDWQPCLHNKPLNYVRLSHVVYPYISMKFGCMKLQHEFVATSFSWISPNVSHTIGTIMSQSASEPLLKQHSFAFVPIFNRLPKHLPTYCKHIVVYPPSIGSLSHHAMACEHWVFSSQQLSFGLLGLWRGFRSRAEVMLGIFISKYHSFSAFKEWTHGLWVSTGQQLCEPWDGNIYINIY